MAFVPPTEVVPFPFWNAYTPTLPEIYWDVDSHEERIKKICLLLHKLVEYSDYLGNNINLDHETIDELQKQFQNFIDGEYSEYYEQVISDWVQNNMPNIITDAIRMVFFGLTADGYFCAWIPDSWSDIWFDTGANYNRSDYGCLMILFQADGAPEYTYVSDFDTLEQMIVSGDEALGNRIIRTERTLYTDVSEGGE